MGYALAKELVKREANVILMARNEKNLKKCYSHLQELVKGKQNLVSYAVCDVTNYDQLKSSLASINLVPDILFCCAGMSKPGNFLQQPLSDFEQCMKLNYFGTLYSIKVNWY